MANLSVTAECNRTCSYCFTEFAMKSVRPAMIHMSRSIFLRSLDFLEYSGMGQVRLLGGEPTLHPEFEWLVDQVQNRGMRLLIFSNGLMPENALSKLERLSPDQVSVLININAHNERKPGEFEKQSVTLQRLGSLVTLGFNIHTPNLQLDFVFDTIREFWLTNTIRLGLAHRCIGGDNKFLHPKLYKEAGHRLSLFSKAAQREGVRLEFDCGFVPCMFADGDSKMLGEEAESIGKRCNPILDVLPDGQVIPCYPLAAICRKLLSEARDAKYLRIHFQKQLQHYRSIGIFRECSTCQLRQAQRCMGGCLAAAMQRLRHAPFAVTLP